MLDFDNGMDMYFDARLPQIRMLTHPISTVRSSLFLSFFFYSSMVKKYFHSSKWGSIPRYPSHSATKAEMC